MDIKKENNASGMSLHKTLLYVVKPLEKFSPKFANLISLSSTGYTWEYHA